MKIVFLTPTHQSTARGNTVTVNRWAEGLRTLGHEVTVFENNEASQVVNLAPDIIHAHHAVHCGPTALELARASVGAALVVSLGGTDLHGAQGSPQEAGRRALAGAQAVVGPFANDGEKLRAAFPECAPFFVVPRGVAVFAAHPRPQDQPIRGIVIGGIRPVKGQLDALRWLSESVESCVPFTLDFAGPIIDPHYGEKFLVAVGENAGAHYCGELSPDETKSLIDSADFLLNSSVSEGASNAILEALARGRPVAARAIPGNVGLLASAPKEIALLFVDEKEGVSSLYTWLKRLGSSPPQETIRLAQRFVTESFSLESELDALEGVYNQVLLASE